MFCRKCGTKLDDDAVFCHSCGEKVSVPPKDDKAKDEGDAAKECPTEEAATVGTSEPTEEKPIASVPEQNTEKETVEVSRLYVPDKDFKEMFIPWVSGSRLNRLRYFKRTLAVNAVYLLLTILFVGVMGASSEGNYIIAAAIGNVLILPFQYWLDVRRARDMGFGPDIARARIICFLVQLGVIWNYGEKWQLGAEILGIVLGLVLLLAPGNKEENQYGADPLGPTAN